MSSARDAAVEVVRELRRAGFTAYFAGGCVRDEVLGVVPQDYDVATAAPPDNVRALFRHVSEVGASFGVMLHRVGGNTIEIATFRTEGLYSDKRRPDAVVYADAEHDARRRDFTINALFLDPLAPASVIEIGGRRGELRGAVIDHVGGLPDLRAGVVRAVGDPERRLAEDHLRALRAVRFSARLGFTLDAATAEAITRHAGELEGVSRERVGDELRRMLGHPSRAEAIALMQALGLDAPALLDDEGAAAEAPVLATRLPAEADAVLALAVWALARRVGGAELPRALDAALSDHAVDGVVRRLRESLCLSNDERDRLRAALGGARRLREDLARVGLAQQKRWLGAAWCSDAVALLHAADPASARSAEARAARLAATPSGLAPVPLINGSDLLGLGIAPGAALGRLLEAVYDLQLEDRVRTRGEALEAAGRLGDAGGSSIRV